jgi:hypothetical protein
MHWIPEIVYEQSEGKDSKLPFIHLPDDATAPPVLFFLVTKKTDETEKNENGEDIPVLDMELTQYGNMNLLRDNLPSQVYDEVRRCLGLTPLAEATASGVKITESIRKNLEV